jgi:AraC-like DNA-binding protein
LELDPILINQPPELNRIVERNFKRFPIYLRKEQLGAHREKLHVQPGVEINLSLEGEAVFVVGHQIYRQQPGQMILFPGNVPHQVFIDASRYYKRAVICIDDVFLRPNLSDSVIPLPHLQWFANVPCCHVQLEPKTFAMLKQTVFLMYEELQEQKTGWEQMLVAQMLSLAVMVKRIMEDESPHGRQLAPRNSSRELIALCCSYIDSNLNEDLSLQNVARLFHISPEHLTRLFKREKGMAYYQYVMLRRIMESKRLMAEHPDMSLTEIAYAVGFANSSHFSRAFKSVTGRTPSEYRNRASIH